MSRDLLLDRERIELLATSDSDKYKTFHIGARRIDAPMLELKYVQSWIHDLVVAETPEVPSYVTAYEGGCSIRKNAEAHRENAHMLCMDIRHFFRSCTSDMVSNFFGSMTIGRRCATLSGADVSTLTGLATLRGSLPMGSPCSPVIANRVMLDVDRELAGRLGPGVIYTRYSDDICVSSHDRIDVGAVVAATRGVLEARGFELNTRKVRCMGRGDARRVTGVYITKDGNLSIGSRRKRELNDSLYRFLIHGEGSPAHIRGLLDFARMVDPAYVGRVLVKYENYGSALRCGGVMGALKAASIGEEEG